MKLIADEQILFESPDPAGIYCYTPAILVGENRRLIAAVDLGGPGTAALEGPRSRTGDYQAGNQIRIFLSDDGGESWRESASRLPMMHETLFRTSSGLWMLGHSGALLISRSTDNGESWSTLAVLESEHHHHQSCGRVDIHNGRVYAVSGELDLFKTVRSPAGAGDGGGGWIVRDTFPRRLRNAGNSGNQRGAHTQSGELFPRPLRPLGSIADARLHRI